MIGILLLFFIGKYYYKLAEAHDKSKWGYAILGIVMYYASVVVSGLLLGIVIELIWPGAVDTINELLLSILVLPFVWFDAASFWYCRHVFIVSLF